jgi:hypothetical protein
MAGTAGTAARLTPEARRRVEPDRVVRVERAVVVAVERVDGVVAAAGVAPAGAKPQSVQ